MDGQDHRELVTDAQTAPGQTFLNAEDTITVSLIGTETTVRRGVSSITCTINNYPAAPQLAAMWAVHCL